MMFPCSASSYLYRDQAGQLEMPLHHGEPAQEVSTLGAKVWEFPGQKCQPGTDGNNRNKAQSNSGAEEKQISGSD